MSSRALRRMQQEKLGAVGVANVGEHVEDDEDEEVDEGLDDDNNATVKKKNKKKKNRQRPGNIFDILAAEEVGEDVGVGEDDDVGNVGGGEIAMKENEPGESVEAVKT